MENAAIVLAAGRGSRMRSSVQKQYMELSGHPVLYYSLRAFEDFDGVDQVILVTGKEEIEYCRTQIVERYGFRKVRHIVAGGAERYDSVYEGLKAVDLPCGCVMIHDGARPLIDEALLQRNLACAMEYRACVAAVPVKDTIKVADEHGFAVRTPDRSTLWTVQTPQSFAYDLIMEAYQKLYKELPSGITDDAMVVERMMGLKIRLAEGSYCNIKITTPEDLPAAETFLRKL